MEYPGDPHPFPTRCTLGSYPGEGRPFLVPFPRSDRPRGHGLLPVKEGVPVVSFPFDFSSEKGEPPFTRECLFPRRSVGVSFVVPVTGPLSSDRNPVPNGVGEAWGLNG